MYTRDQVYAKHRMAFPGTFDPFTLGHLSIIQRVSLLCDELLVVVFDNPQKMPVMARHDRADLIRRAVHHMSAVRVMEYDGLLVNFCKDEGVDTIVRGVRSGVQFAEEQAMAEINWRIGDGTDTVLLPALADLRHISSSMVREIVSMGGDIKGFVPDLIEADIVKAYGDRQGRKSI